MAEDHIPTAAEYALFREAYAETYPVRPLLNAIDAKDAEIRRLQTVDRMSNDAYREALVLTRNTLSNLLAVVLDQTIGGEHTRNRNAAIAEARTLLGHPFQVPADETSPVLPCDKCGRGVDEHVGIGMPCPETEPGT